MCRIHISLSPSPAGHIKHPRRKTPKACWWHPSDGCGEAIRSLCIFVQVQRGLDNVYTAMCLMRGALCPLSCVCISDAVQQSY